MKREMQHSAIEIPGNEGIPENFEMSECMSENPKGQNGNAKGGSGKPGNFSNDTYVEALKETIKCIKCHPTDLDTVREKFNEKAASLFNPPENAAENIFHFLATTRNKNLVRILWAYEEETRSIKFEHFDLTKNAKKLLCANSKKGGKESPLHVAVRYGFVEFLNEVLSSFPNLVRVQNYEGCTLLHVAIQNTGPEGLLCMEEIIKAAQHENILQEMLLDKSYNKMQPLPLHLLCQNVPSNESAQVLDRLRLLMDYKMFAGCIDESNFNWNVDAKGKTCLHLLCSKEYQGREYEDNENGKALFKELVNRRGGVNSRTRDKDERTPLHLAVINGYHDLVEILVSNEDINVAQKDSYGKMPIHYAAELAIWPKHRECFKHLVSWPMLNGKMKPSEGIQETLFKRYLLEETCEVVEQGGKFQHTALTLACHSKSAKSVELLLKNMCEANEDPGSWFKDHMNKNSHIFSLRPVFKSTPNALEFLFDKSIKVVNEESNERAVTVITDISLLSGLIKPIRSHEVASEVKYLEYANEWNGNIQEKLLLHPLTQCALSALWDQMRLFKMIWILGNILWLLFYCILVPIEYDHSENGKMLSSRGQLAAAALGVMVVIRIIYDSDEIYHLIHHLIRRKWKKVQKSIEMNKWNWVQIVLTSLIVLGPFTGMRFIREEVESLLAAIGVFLAFLMFWRNISFIYLPLGIQVEYLIQTLSRILVAFLCLVPIIIGFERAFRQILPEAFNSASLFAFVRMLVMTTGEFEFKDIFEVNGENSTSSSGKDVEENVSDLTFKLLAFAVFLIFLPIAFYNLVTGLVVDKIQQMEKTLQIKQILNHIRLINHIHRTHWSKFICLFSLLPCLQPCYVSYRFAGEGTHVIYDAKLKWIINRDIRRPSSFLLREGCCWCKELICIIIKGICAAGIWISHLMCSVGGRSQMEVLNTTSNINTPQRVRCGDSLPDNVKEKLFTLDTQNQL